MPEFLKNKKTVWLIALILALILLAGSVFGIVKTFMPDKTDYSGYKNDVSSSDNTSVDEQGNPEIPENPIDFESVKKDNAEVCAWIKVDGTNIDYPILQSGDGTEEDFYLDHDIKKMKKQAGSIYIQKLNSPAFDDPNTLIYGHNMLNGSMFAALKKFRNTEFFNENRYITVYTPGHILKYEIFSAFIYDNRHILNSFDFSKPEEYSEFLGHCKNPQSLVRNMLPNAAVATDDKIITLSTCTNNDSERYLVVAVQISDTETK